MYELGTKNIFCDDEVAGIKQVFVKPDLTYSSFYLVTCTESIILHDISRLDSNKINGGERSFSYSFCLSDVHQNFQSLLLLEANN